MERERKLSLSLLKSEGNDLVKSTVHPSSFSNDNDESGEAEEPGSGLDNTNCKRYASDIEDAETQKMEMVADTEKEIRPFRFYERAKSACKFIRDYPTHGVIGSTEPMSIGNLFYKQENQKPDFRKQKFDFHEMYEKDKSSSKQGIIALTSPLPGLGYLCRSIRTEDLYDIDPALPMRFKNPDLFHGYGYERREHPLFRTTSSEYGKFAPSVHDVPHEYHGLKNTFTSHLSSTGMPKNRSLNIK